MSKGLGEVQNHIVEGMQCIQGQCDFEVWEPLDYFVNFLYCKKYDINFDRYEDCENFDRHKWYKVYYSVWRAVRSLEKRGILKIRPFDEEYREKGYYGEKSKIQIALEDYESFILQE